MARPRRGVRLVLISPFTSVPAVGALVYPFLPVALLARDRYENLAKAKQISVPVLVVHGTADEVIPYAMGRELAAAFQGAELLTLDGVGHNFELRLREAPLDRIVEFAARARAQ
jgi:uncharacterized protein